LQTETFYELLMICWLSTGCAQNAENSACFQNLISSTHIFKFLNRLISYKYFSTWIENTRLNFFQPNPQVLDTVDLKLEVTVFLIWNGWSVGLGTWQEVLKHFFCLMILFTNVNKKFHIHIVFPSQWGIINGCLPHFYNVKIEKNVKENFWYFFTTLLAISPKSLIIVEWYRVLFCLDFRVFWHKKI
jgi:hypothetical protein